MSDMADVLAKHGEWRYTNGAGSAIVCRECGAPVENVIAHQAAALSAAGFGPAREAPRVESCPTRLMDGRNEIRRWLNEGHEGECK